MKQRIYDEIGWIISLWYYLLGWKSQSRIELTEPPMLVINWRNRFTSRKVVERTRL